ncbi:MAG TPA: pyridoxamine 5'-phosphate oxidase family protein [Microbacteriaceae bacterium]|nr:pyridoxamine 5'-phosphate oxidase family protein [Microbacteriaceae bacterium]
MSAPQIPGDFVDLLDVELAIFATVGPTGYPQQSAIGFLWEDGVIKTSVHPSRQKFKNATRDGKASYLLVDPAQPLRGIEIRGDVSVEDDPELEYLLRQGIKYGRGLEGFTHEIDNRKILIVTPTRVRTWDLTR